VSDGGADGAGGERPERDGFRDEPSGPTGVVVAGGRSTRFGEGEKALADLGGVAMIRRVADRLAAVVDALVVNCRAEQVPGLRAALAGVGVPLGFAPDPVPDRGPVAGVHAGLGAVESERAFVTGCDTPFVSPALVAHLSERCAGRAAAVPRTTDGRLQPLCAVYRVDPARAAFGNALADGERSLHGALTELDYRVVDPEEIGEYAAPGSFTNVNTLADLAAATARFE
jgi:molybdopterin-guanine dinucleotide biosynthesis protein A